MHSEIPLLDPGKFSGRPDPDFSSHRLYGVDFTGNFPFTVPLPDGMGTPSLQISVDTCLLSEGKVEPTEGRVREISSGATAPVMTMYRAGEATGIYYPPAGNFHLERDRITYLPTSGADPVLAENHLLGPAFSLWLEQQGNLVLHASTLAIDGGAVAFLAASRGGKSSLAAALIRAGAQLMSDDLLVAARIGGHWIAHAGYPQLRMWPDQAGYFMPDPTKLDRVHPLVTKLRMPVDAVDGLFHHSSLPLRAIYLLQRREPTRDLSAWFESVSPAEGMIHLLRHSFLARVFHETEYERLRFPVIADLRRTIPIRQLSFPSGVEYLPSIADAIMRDVRETRA